MRLLITFRYFSIFIFSLCSISPLYSLTQPQNVEYTKFLVMFAFILVLTRQRLNCKVELLLNSLLMLYEPKIFWILFQQDLLVKETDYRNFPILLCDCFLSIFKSWCCLQNSSYSKGYAWCWPSVDMYLGQHLRFLHNIVGIGSLSFRCMDGGNWS